MWKIFLFIDTLKAFYLLANIKKTLNICKFWNEVMVWFMLQCLHPIANDVEENPGSTIFHIIDPTSTDSVFFHLSATRCLAFLTFRLFRAARNPYLLYIKMVFLL